MKRGSGRPQRVLNHEQWVIGHDRFIQLHGGIKKVFPSFLLVFTSSTCFRSKDRYNRGGNLGFLLNGIDSFRTAEYPGLSVLFYVSILKFRMNCMDGYSDMEMG